MCLSAALPRLVHTPAIAALLRVLSLQEQDLRPRTRRSHPIKLEELREVIREGLCRRRGGGKVRGRWGNPDDDRDSRSSWFCAYPNEKLDEAQARGGM